MDVMPPRSVLTSPVSAGVLRFSEFIKPELLLKVRQDVQQFLDSEYNDELPKDTKLESSDLIPSLSKVAKQVSNHVRRIGVGEPSLERWSSDEMSLRLYGGACNIISQHSSSFSGVIAVLLIRAGGSLEAASRQSLSTFTTNPGDLFLLRTTNLINEVSSYSEIEPEVPACVVRCLRTTSGVLMELRNNI